MCVFFVCVCVCVCVCVYVFCLSVFLSVRVCVSACVRFSLSLVSSLSRHECVCKIYYTSIQISQKEWRPEEGKALFRARPALSKEIAHLRLLRLEEFACSKC